MHIRPYTSPDDATMTSRVLVDCHESWQVCVCVCYPPLYAYNKLVQKHRWGLRQVWRQLLHTDWICQLQYVSELNSILSCSLDKRLCLADVEARVTVKYLEGHTQGVRAVDWSRAYSFIASGGLDRNVMLWNPFQLHSMATLTVSQA